MEEIIRIGGMKLVLKNTPPSDNGFGDYRRSEIRLGGGEEMEKLLGNPIKGRTVLRSIRRWRGKKGFHSGRDVPDVLLEVQERGKVEREQT
jgi:hypothetical protein